MTITSLYFQTEMIFWRELSAVEDLGDAIVVRTPSNPTWNWGNLLVLNAPPKCEAIDRWLDIFNEKFAAQPATTYRLITWQGSPASDEVLAVFAEKGMKPSAAEVLTLGELRKGRYNESVHVELLEADDPRWQDVLEINVEAFGPDFSNYRVFAERSIAEHRDMIAKGLGMWYVAMLDNEAVGTVGIYRGDKVYRYQDVSVREKFRRLGVASTMIYEVAKCALEEHPLFPQVIVADDDRAAIRVYHSIGFEKHSMSYAVGGRIQ